jgi:hypothetical protein
MSPEATLLSRALHEGRALSAVVGVPDTSLEAGRAFARWAAAIGELHLALAAWDGCAALDDAPASWLGLAEAALEAGEARRAFEAAARVRAHVRACERDRARATLVSARACLLGGLEEEARAWLRTLRDDDDHDVLRLARTIESTLAGRTRTR